MAFVASVPELKEEHRSVLEEWGERCCVDFEFVPRAGFRGLLWSPTTMGKLRRLIVMNLHHWKKQGRLPGWKGRRRYERGWLRLLSGKEYRQEFPEPGPLVTGIVGELVEDILDLAWAQRTSVVAARDAVIRHQSLLARGENVAAARVKAEHDPSSWHEAADLEAEWEREQLRKYEAPPPQRKKRRQ